MTLEAFKNENKDKTPVELLLLMQQQHDCWRQAVKDRVDANWCGEYNTARQYAGECDDIKARVEWLTDKIVAALTAQESKEARLLTADEIKHLQDRKTICVEQLLSRETDAHGYATALGWGVMCNRTNVAGNGLLVSMLGTFWPQVINQIPYLAIDTGDDGKQHHIMQYRFWSEKPTSEQSKAVKWE